MEYRKDFLFYANGKVDERLLTKIRYDFYVVDAVYSDVTKTVQILYELTHPHTNEDSYLLENYEPLSQKFNDVMGRVFYTLECSPIKKVCLDDFKELTFSAELFNGVNGIEIDWQTARPIEATMSPTFELFDAIGMTDTNPIEDISRYETLYTKEKDGVINV